MTTTRHGQHPGVVETRLVHDVHRRATSLLAAADPSGPVDALDELRQFVVGTLHHHHHCEDTDLWPMLVDADPDLSRALHGLSQEHQMLADALDVVDVTGIDTTDDRQLLQAKATDLRDLVHEHLAHEEPILLPALSEHVSADAWDQFSRRTVSTSPPEGGHLMLFLLYEIGSSDQVDLMVRHVPPADREQFPAMRAQGARTLAALGLAEERRAPSAGSDVTPVNAQVIDEFRANDGRVGGRFESVPLLLLHTRGARSGRRHVVPLLYQADGERLVVFASNGGAPSDPDWYRNACAHPDVVAELGSELRPCRARSATRHERQRFWSGLTSRFPRYAHYEAMTEREIPIVVLEPEL